MHKFRYFLREPGTGIVKACVTIYKQDDRNYHRVITLTHPNMKLKRGESIKKSLAEYADKIGDEWIANEFKTDIPVKFSPRIWEPIEALWIWTYGTINMPDADRFMKNCKLCNHEYRMIVGPHGNN